MRTNVMELRCRVAKRRDARLTFPKERIGNKFAGPLIAD
jgi:hypothetical protein